MEGGGGGGGASCNPSAPAATVAGTGGLTCFLSSLISS